ncbi:hypothetical protein FRC04_008398 [Tulasnella sp. 424]|nr:hypothetical protein FRC04_008398 [Tulasnella sp. 424]
MDPTVDTRINPPHTTWHHPLDDTRYHQTQSISVLAKGTSSSPYLSSDSEQGAELDSDDIDAPRKKSAGDLRRRVTMYHESPNSATHLSSSGQNRDIVEALDPREFHPRPTLPATTHEAPVADPSSHALPDSLPFVRREPEWARRVDKIFDRLQKKEDKLDRRAEKWTGKYMVDADVDMAKDPRGSQQPDRLGDHSAFLNEPTPSLDERLQAVLASGTEVALETPFSGLVGFDSNDSEMQDIEVDVLG